MLLEFVFSNHRSFRSEAFFSLVAAPDNTHGDALADYAGHKILRSALLYGANGTGKSTVIDALCFVRDLVCTSVCVQPAGCRHPVPSPPTGRR